MSPDARSQLADLQSAVQTNCDISDARHARDYSLCVYLLKMRELYRWEQGLEQTEVLDRDQLGDWVMRREALWEELDESEFHCLPLAQRCLEPFESRAVNDHVMDRDMVYSAGYGRFIKPHFFLAELDSVREQEGFRIFVAGRELARDLTAPPAMTQDREIFVRRESLRRFLWERVEEWRWRRQEDPMARAVALYPFDDDPGAALEAMTDNELASVVAHELGEARVGEELGSDWSALIMRLAQGKGELLARAVRDLLADCIATLPSLLEREDAAGLHFFFANLRGMRGELAPGLQAAYEHWRGNGDVRPLARAARNGAGHWRSVIARLLQMYAEMGEASTDGLVTYMEGAGL